MARWKWIADILAEDVRADRALLRALESGQGEWSESAAPEAFSRNQLQKLLEAGGVRTADGKALKASTKLSQGMRIEAEFPAPRPMELVPEDRPLDILYEDEHLAVINKPAGLTVHPSETQHEGTLVHALLHHIQDLSGIGGVLRPGIVHRLDKDTSGALVITKSDLAHQRLTETFSKHAIERRYWALCYGRVAGANTKELRIESLIARNLRDRKKMTMDTKEGRKAVTYVRELEAYGQAGKAPFASWIEARLETGRTHQVRVHLTGQGNSLLGDPVYGQPSARHPKWLALPEDVRRAVAGLAGQALHARVLGFDHPVTGKPLRFEAPEPPAFLLLHQVLRRYC